jgi:HJR/Mrr/RecB family endonuclease
MYHLTEHKKIKARDVLDRYTRHLHDHRSMDAGGLERELRQLWGLGYQTLKDIMIDILSNHQEYAHLAAYYMEHSNAPGVVSEFLQPLANLYGLTSWYYDDEKEAKRDAYWENAFALISQFDLNKQHDGSTILQISSVVNDRLIEYFLEKPSHLRSMMPRYFEELIAELFDGFGFAVELTQSTRDGGRDVIAIGNERIAASKYLIECKRYAESNKVGIQPVRSLYGVVTNERATKGILVTTSSFTGPAEEFLQRNKWVLEGRAFDDIVEWLHEYQRLKFPPLQDA